MTEERENEILPGLNEANTRLAVNVGDMSLPLDIQIRTIALTVAQRHCGDTIVKEGNLYQHLKMDNKLAGPLTIDHVLRCALIFETYLWGKWSKGIAGGAMEEALEEMNEALKKSEFNVDGVDEPPIRPHSES